MHRQIQFKTAVPSVGDSVKRSRLQCRFLLISRHSSLVDQFIAEIHKANRLSPL